MPKESKNNKMTVSSRSDLADFFGVKNKYINWVLYADKSASGYKKFTINKASGKIRTLHAVTKKLKKLQRIALDHLQADKRFQPTAYSHGFTQQKSIITNAAYHKRSKRIIKMDIKDFFPTIHFGRVQGMFMAPPFKFGKEAATVMAQMSCLDDGSGALPQGGVLSPYIANMMCRRMDKRLAAVARNHSCRFTRYADDLTFSTNCISDENIGKLVQEASAIVEAEHFIVNKEKTKVLTPKDRQVVTGIVVNDGLNVNRKYIRNLRAIIRNCEQFGIKSQIVKLGGFKDNRNSRISIKGEENLSEERFLRHILGKLNFMGDVVFANLNDKDGKKIDDNSVNMNRMVRIKTHADLLTRFYKLVAGVDGVYDKIEISIVNNGKKNPYCKIMDLISEINNQDRKYLDEFERLEGVTRIVDGKKYPLVDKKQTRVFLDSFRNSINGMGAFTHAHGEEFTIHKAMGILLKKCHPAIYYLPEAFEKEISSYIHYITNIGIKNGANYSWNVMSDTKSVALKRATRFDSMENSLSSTVDSCIRYVKKQNNISSDLNVINCIKNNQLLQIYTFVPGIESALNNIIHSMLKNTEAQINKYILIDVNQATDLIEIIVRSEDIMISSFVPEDKHGKLTLATKSTKGLCDYWVEVDSVSLDLTNKRVCFDMHTGKIIDGIIPSFSSGFVHKLRFDTADKIRDTDVENREISAITPIENKIDYLYKVLLLDHNIDDRREIKRNLLEIDGVSEQSLTILKNISQVDFESMKLDIAFIHKNNKETSNIALWETSGIKVIFFSGEIRQNSTINAEKSQFMVKEETMKSAARLKSYFEKKLSGKITT